MEGTNGIMEKRKYYSIEVARLFVSICIVLLHSTPTGGGGTLLHSILMFGVPFFFIISGFFAFRSGKERNEERIKKNIKYYLKFYIIAEIIYIVLSCIYATCFLDIDIITYLKSWLNTKEILEVILINDIIFDIGGPIWYIQALLYCYVIFYFFNKYDIFKYSNIIIVVTLIINSVVGEFSSVFSLDAIFPDGYIGGCFITRGIPFMLIGYNICHNEDFYKKISNKCCLIMIILGMISSILECTLLKTTGHLVYRGYYQGNMIIAFFLFVLCINNAEYGKNSKLSIIGKKYSLGIYLIHQPLIIFVYAILMNHNISLWFTFLIVMPLAFILLWMYYKSKDVLLPQKNI